MGRPRKVQTPGVQPAGDEPAPGADLEQFETEELPALPAGADAQIALAAEAAARKRLERRIAELERTKADRPGKPTHEIFSTEDAMRLAREEVAAGKRPRARLTPTGWYCHPEAARVAAPVL
jgi:hypothetical protein